MKHLAAFLLSRLTQIRIASFYLSMFFIVIALLGVLAKGINFGLDFTGGYLTEFSFNQPLAKEVVTKHLEQHLTGPFELSSGQSGHYWTLRQADDGASVIAKEWFDPFAQTLSAQLGLTVTLQDSVYIGSQIGDELINQGGLALMAAIMAILFYLSFRFEWRLALGAVAALFHDVIIVIGVFAWFGISFDLTILASLLAIIGYSLNDSIVIGDKIRELMQQNAKLDKPLDQLINSAIKATMLRTVITSGTTLVTIVSVWLLAGASLSGFATALFTGVIMGTFSSIAILATVPQLVGLTVDYYQRKQEIGCDLP
ncbi:protein translocase subunit SecF [Psychrobium sp. 1_MG-2023]|uniref:protein translocase subunit SecF n=1 Tax=Psychrobium sp. 1_MG-2023 TaxID=3062624 RepID=UPI000C32516E|nr:protein translocase subunit SecF [Psychrobium sp. 1_MG-2023]MDP2561342.1 protein translocase subunit SecF [Psychrobium sp. 1_MG-2023]PKF54155.1 protein translocase subunit SecF [Alteromonadales bacterium alter-6D02]